MEHAILQMLKNGPLSSLEIIRRLGNDGFWFPRWRAYGCLAALEDNHVVRRTVLTQKLAFDRRFYQLERHIYSVA